VLWLPDEFRLVVLLAVNALLCVAAFRLARHLSGRSGIGSVMDGLLIVYAVQYLSVCLTGLLGVLSAESMYGLATLASLVMLYVARRRQPLPAQKWSADRILVGAAALFVVGYLIGFAWVQGAASFPGDDALTYHLPIPAIWLRDHRLSLQTIWFFNPANTYSPMAGETFITWLLAPVGNDVVVRYVQMPAMLLLLAAMIEVITGLGMRPGAAALVALAAVLCRAIVAQAALVKDDLFLAAFFMTAVAGLAPPRLADRLGPWRVGIAAGLFLATKYTALPMAPLLLLAVDAPLRAGWKRRHWLIAVGCVVLLAGPWYLRNWIVAGNPLYPVTLNLAGIRIFDGLFIPERSTQMRTFGGAWTALTGMYQSLSPALMVVLIIGSVVGLALSVRRLRDPLLRLCVIGPLIGMAIFIFLAHAAEIRYAEPPLLLMFAAAGLAIASLRPPPLALAAAAALALFSGAGGFEARRPLIVFFSAGIVLATLGMLAAIYASVRIRSVLVALGAVVAAGWIYVYWLATIGAVDGLTLPSMMLFYPKSAEVWAVVERDLPPEAPIAYTNLHLIRPLMGFNYQRPVFYVPVRPDVRAYHNLPPSDQPLTDQQLRPWISTLLLSDPQMPQWQQRLLQSPAAYLLVGKQPDVPPAPELTFAKQAPERFRPVFENEAAALFRIIR
jgi:hypothetical protein